MSAKSKPKKISTKISRTVTKTTLRKKPVVKSPQSPVYKSAYNPPGAPIKPVEFSEEYLEVLRDYGGSTDYPKLDPKHIFLKDKFDQYDSAVKEIINNKLCMVTHLSEHPIIADTYSRQLDLSKQEKYEERFGQYKNTLHWGQLKLMLSEIEFLTIAIQNYKSSKKIYFVYAGAAPGDHINTLQRMFPSIYFELYDPNKFIVKDNAHLKTHVQFFTNADAEYWRDAVTKNNLFLIFCSDIRTEPATNANVIRNMNMQLEWWKIMNPDLSMFKFRLPWEKGSTPYPDGDIYIQAFPGPTSTETRLIVKKDAKIIEYNHTTYEQACFYHNTILRQQDYRKFMHDKVYDLQRDGIDNCYDCATLCHILESYYSLTKQHVDILDAIHKLEKTVAVIKSTIKLKTVLDNTQRIELYRRYMYKPCGDEHCTVCMSGKKIKSAIKKGISKATIENEEKYMEKFIDGYDSD
jgi:hypothetical protein